jgi:iron(III) transport system substrate-binding protein
MYRLTFGAALAAILTAVIPVPATADGEVNLYSTRQPDLIKPVLDAFTKSTGIKANVVYVQKGLIERLKAEGANSPADAVLTVDIGELDNLQKANVLQPVNSPVLTKNIPAHLRHPDNLWYALTLRARILMVSKDRVKPNEVTSYEDLTKPSLKKQICIRSGKHEYNISLIASVIAHEGLDGARKWLDGVKNNLARKPQGSDRSGAKGIYEGVCDVAVANTYYMGLMTTNDKEPEQKKWAEAIRVVFPNQNGRGTHVNVSGAGITASAKNKANAIKLLEFLSSDQAQNLYARENFEYPVKAGVELHPVVKSWGKFKADTINLTEIAKHRAAAARLVDELGFDQFEPGA